MSRAAAGRGFLAISLLAAAACLDCHDSPAPIGFTPTPPPANPRTITVTLDQCDCLNCRVGVINPVSGLGLLSRVDPLPGLEVTADTCYNASTVKVTVECGDCPGPSACTASATLKASGVTLGPPASCTTAPFPGQSCADNQIDTIPGTAPVVGC